MTQLYSKNGGMPQRLPFQDSEEDGTVWTDLENSEEGRAACGWVAAGVPPIVSRMQLKQALNQADLLQTVEDNIASAPKTIQIYWSDTSDFHRDHPMLELFANAFGLSDEQIDAIFMAAKVFT